VSGAIENCSPMSAHNTYITDCKDVTGNVESYTVENIISTLAKVQKLKLPALHDKIT
jgi:alpha-acetolactate decarboxylase